MNTGSEGNYASVSCNYLTKAFLNLDGIKRGFNIWISQDGLLLVHNFKINSRSWMMCFIRKMKSK